MNAEKTELLRNNADARSQHHAMLVDDFRQVILQAKSITNLKMLRLNSVVEKVGLSRPTIWKRVADGTFPPPVPVGERAVGWFQHEVDALLQATAISSRKHIPLNLHLFVERLTEVGGAES
jgi:prophage regulatory protein